MPHKLGTSYTALRVPLSHALMAGLALRQGVRLQSWKLPDLKQCLGVFCFIRPLKEGNILINVLCNLTSTFCAYVFHPPSLACLLGTCLP